MWWFAGCAAPMSVDTGSSAGFTLSGRVLDVAGDPISGAELQVCADVCVLGVSDDEGAYAVDGLWAGRWSVHVAAEDAAAFLPMEVGAESMVDVVVAPLGPEITLPEEPTEVEVAPGLTLTLSAAALPWTDTVRAGALDGYRWPELLDVDGAVATGWVLTPFGVDGAVPFRVLGDGGTWCTAPDGLSWAPCDVLSTLGAIVQTR
jgi:hypothetical protein